MHGREKKRSVREMEWKRAYKYVRKRRLVDKEGSVCVCVEE